MTIQPWPTTYVPPILETLPALKLQSTYGERTFTDLSQRMYVCGITPYDSTHLGHAATYITFDLINRYLQAGGSAISFVENITDIDEPLLERAERDNIDWKDLAINQIKLFQSDMTDLHILPPMNFVPATTVMDLIDIAIQRLNENGFVYSVENDLYFSIESFLQDLPLPLEKAKEIFSERGGDPDRKGKKHPLDPVLWLANKDGEPGWASSHGFGRPGWHIECAVISLKFLLDEKIFSANRSFEDAPLIDIQGGGSDLIFPHHFMSAAQAQAITGRPFAKAYIHTGMIGLDGEKMSKSKGNLVFVSGLVKSGVDPMVIRLALIREHYSTDRMWTEQLLMQSEQIVERIRLNLSKSEVAPALPLIRDLGLALSNDLDTPAAISRILQWCHDSEQNPSVDEAGIVSRGLDSLLGLAL